MLCIFIEEYLCYYSNATQQSFNTKVSLIINSSIIISGYPFASIISKNDFSALIHYIDTLKQIWNWIIIFLKYHMNCTLQNIEYSG